MAQKASVLIIESDHELVSILGAFFSSINYRVQKCSRVQEAIHKSDSQKYTVILLEAKMSPEKSENFLTALKTKGHPNYKTPVILMTKDVQHQMPPDAFTNVIYLLEKPFKLKELFYALTK